MPAVHFNYLDGWRGLAISFLLLGHFFPIPGINMGTVGVNLFFVLSGLLMARLLFIQQVPIPLFYKRRIARIFPAAMAFIALIVLARLAWNGPLEYAEVLAAATFVNNYFQGQQGANIMPFGHFWSLCVEEHSYIVLSLIALAARRWRAGAGSMILAATVGIAACALWYAAHYSGAQLAALWLHTEVAAFGIFASAALLLWFQGRRLPRLPSLAYVALAGLGITLHWWSVPAPARTIAGVGLFALTINLLANAPPALHAVMAFKPLRQLGLWSFSIYVWQQPFYLWSRHHGLPAPAGLALALAAGVASFYLIERPARAWLNRAPAAPSPVRAAPHGG